MDSISVAYTSWYLVFLCSRARWLVDFHNDVFRLCALKFVHRCRPLYIIYLSRDSPQMLLILSYQCPGGMLHYYRCHWVSHIFFSTPLILACLYSHSVTAEVIFSTQRKIDGYPWDFPCAMNTC